MRRTEPGVMSCRTLPLSSVMRGSSRSDAFRATLVRDSTLSAMRRLSSLLPTPIALVLLATAFTRLAELKGPYQIAIGVNEQSYTGTFTITPHESNQFTAE